MDRDKLLMPTVLQKRMLFFFEFIVIDNWVVGPDQTEVVNVLEKLFSVWYTYSIIYRGIARGFIQKRAHQINLEN